MTRSELPSRTTGKTKKKNHQTLDEGSTKDEADHYEVEHILAHEWDPEWKTQRFYVKWKGYPNSDNSWVKQEDFDDVAILKKYWKATNERIRSKNEKTLVALDRRTGGRKPPLYRRKN